MPEGLGFKAWISVTSSGNCSKVLQEYRTEVDPRDETVITTWIPSEAGKEFEVSWNSLENSETDISGSVYADGMYMGGMYMFKNSPPTRTSFVNDAITSKGNRTRRLFFTPLQVTDDHCFLRKALSVFKRSAKNIGEIKLDIYEATVDDPIEADSCTVKVKEIKTVEEKLKKKGIVHGVGFGPETPDEDAWHFRHVTHKKRVVTFVFKYRPLDVLKAHGIVCMSKRDAEKKE